MAEGQASPHVRGAQLKATGLQTQIWHGMAQFTGWLSFSGKFVLLPYATAAMCNK